MSYHKASMTPQSSKKVGEFSVSATAATALALVLASLCFGAAALYFDTAQLGRLHLHVPLWLLIVGAIFMIAVHELIHYTCALLFAGQARIRIHVLTWQCTFERPMSIANYQIYSMMPAIVQCAAGLTVMLASEQMWMRELGMLITTIGLSGGAGDFVLSAKALRFPSNAWVVDKGLTIEVYGPQQELT